MAPSAKWLIDEDLVDQAIEELKTILPENSPITDEDARIAICETATNFWGKLVIRRDLQNGAREVAALIKAHKDAITALEHARDRCRRAGAALNGLSDPTWSALFSGRDRDALSASSIKETLDCNSDEVLSDKDFDQMVDTLKDMTSKLNEAAAQQKSYLEHRKTRKSRPDNWSERDLVRTCADLVSSWGGDDRIAKSSNGPFHRFVIAVANIAGVEDISYNHLLAGIRRFSVSR